MSEITEEIIKNFGNRLRIRVCGLCERNDALLLIRHHSIESPGYIWIPPGGGVQYGERIKDALQRELLEESNMQIEIKELVYIHEYVKLPLHAVELFFRITSTSTSILGSDPEMSVDTPILTELRWMNREELKKEDSNALHPVVQLWMKGSFPTLPTCLK